MRLVFIPRPGRYREKTFAGKNSRISAVFSRGSQACFLAGCEGRRFLLALGGGLTIGNWGKSIAIGLSDFLRNAFDHLPRISGARLYIPIIRDDAVQ